MAVSQNTLIGKTKQSVGGVTFTSWKGRNVIKSKAIAVANPRTPAQVAQRTQFSGCVKFFAAFSAILGLAMSRLATNVTASNKWSMLNIKSFSPVDGHLVVFPEADLVMSQGDLGAASFYSPTQIVGTECRAYVNYVPNPSKALATDMMRVIVYDSIDKKMYFGDDVATAGNQMYSFGVDIPDSHKCFVWAFSYSATGKLLGSQGYESVMSQ